MTIDKIVAKFNEDPNRLRMGAGKLAQRWGVSRADINKARALYRAKNYKQNTIKRLFFDIETSYNVVKSWRIGYNLNINPEDIIHERAIICMSYKWEGEDKVHTVYWDENQDDRRVVETFVKIAQEADEMVGHNIDKYDTPFLLTRAIKHGILALPKYNTYDTLKKAKYHFNFNSNKLNYIGQFLGLGEKEKHEGMKMWDDIILRNDKQALKDMISYCERDVILTEDVYNKLRLYTTKNAHVGSLLSGDKTSCPNCGSHRVSLLKTVVTPTGQVKRIMHCEDCEQSYLISNIQYINHIKNS